MANLEESSPLLPNQQEEEQMAQPEMKSGGTAKTTAPPHVEAVKQLHPEVPMGWPADGLPLSVMGLLGSMAPCVLYGSNVERVGYTPGTFSNHCLPYTALYLLGNSFVGWNCLAPWFSFPVRSAIRRKFNLEGNCEALARSCGCCGSFMENEVQREQFESACDFATHVFCHACALCQEGREVRRRLPHPGFNAQPVLVMIPPGEQAMGHGV
ncbi:unnamed protein product [Fraxinus pennsylvanica]|uniref:PLAC8 family protein n=1 Tax=Fraxinus pennsylvanica TaxID=56036 RepID=A0AAD2A847_9LAMI|nr:unnamed protein product [Fraxinus pennsylvanica]